MGEESSSLSPGLGPPPASSGELNAANHCSLCEPSLPGLYPLAASYVHGEHSLLPSFGTQFSATSFASYPKKTLLTPHEPSSFVILAKGSLSAIDRSKWLNGKFWDEMFIHTRTAYIFHKSLVYVFCPFKTLPYLFWDYVFLHPSNQDRGKRLPISTEQSINLFLKSRKCF